MFDVLSRHPDRYEVRPSETGTGFIGRLKLRSPYRGRTTRANFENHYADFEVQEILREPYTGRSFRGYEDIDLPFDELETLVRNEQPDRKSALENVKGIYLLTDLKTVAKWVDRFRKDGIEGLRDRSSRPHSSPSQTPLAARASVGVLRRQRYTGKQIAIELGLSAATVSRILRRLGLNKINALEPAEPVRRYQRERPGEMIHLDIKKLGKINGIEATE